MIVLEGEERLRRAPGDVMRKRRASAEAATGLLLLLLATVPLTTCGQPTTTSGNMTRPHALTSEWYMAWRAETVFPQLSDIGQTCRFTAQLTAGGSQLRAEFTSPDVPRGSYTILEASVADATGEGLDIRGSTGTELTFAGRPGVVVGAGTRVLSDPVTLPTTGSSLVAVTVTASAGEAPTTPNAIDVGACTPSPLETAKAASAPGGLFTVPSHVMWLRSLQVYGPQARSVAAFGDSITVSPQLPLHTYWTDVLGQHQVAVVNAGVGGSYLTTIGMYGTAVGLYRLNDLLAEPGLTDVVMLIGTNDLAVGVHADHVLSALTAALQAAHARTIRLWVCTILPRAGSEWTAASEQARLAVNASLRSSWLSKQGGRLIDTDVALRDPSQASRLLPAYDSGDHVHPNAAGAQHLGIVIGLAIGLLL